MPRTTTRNSAQLPVAVLELLAAAARARIVAADLVAVADDRRLRALRRGGGAHVFRLFVGAVAAGVGVLELGLVELGLDRKSVV